jgi:hypothetical protein
VKRTINVMVRLTPAELAALHAIVPPGEELAVFARRTLLSASRRDAPPSLRSVAAFIVAALSPEIRLAEATALFDEWVTKSPHSVSEVERDYEDER